MALSQLHLLALGYKNKISVWKDFSREGNGGDKYMSHSLGKGVVSSLEFCPYEDILTIGHSKGTSNMIVPGSGDPIYDSYEESPYQTKKQRQEMEVNRLLEKIPYTLITMNEQVGSIKKVDKLNVPDVKVRYFEEKPRKNALDRFYQAEIVVHLRVLPLTECNHAKSNLNAGF
jgi:U3 small nucleolar RNA-associated protein 7